MTEKLFTGTLNKNQNKKKQKLFMDNRIGPVDFGVILKCTITKSIMSHFRISMLLFAGESICDDFGKNPMVYGLFFTLMEIKLVPCFRALGI